MVHIASRRGKRAKLRSLPQTFFKGSSNYVPGGGAFVTGRRAGRGYIYTCPVCKKLFSTAKMLSGHLQEKHPEKKRKRHKGPKQVST